jgi:hypothetical protein
MQECCVHILHLSPACTGVCDKYVGANAVPLVAVLLWLYMLQPD